MAFCAAIATAVALGACGGLPGNAVVQIGSATLSNAAFLHWLTIANDGTQLENGTKASALPVPPDYTACIKAAQKAAGGGPSTRTPGEISTYKSTCESDFNELMTEVLNYLIPRMWIQGEAYDRGIHVTQKEIDASLAQARETSTDPPLKTAKELRAYLAASGETYADLRWDAMVELLLEKIEQQIEREAGKVTPAEIASYYAKHASQYTTPETRDLHLVLTKTLATADEAKSLLASGESYATVAPKYSIDPSTNTKGGVMTGVTTSELTPQLSAQVFKAKVGVLSGPVKTAFGYYVFTVDKVFPATKETLKQATPSIKAAIKQSKVNSAESYAFGKGLTKKWAPRTVCREGYQVATYCSNPPPKSSSSSASSSSAAGG